MNFITRALTSALVLLVSASPVLATPAYFQDHIELLETVEDVGVRVYINSSHCDDDKFHGFYIPMGYGTMVICQENRIKGSHEMVSWTEGDLNTLRHESHHLVQDCIGGSGRGDKVLVPVFKNEYGVIRFVEPILGQNVMNRIAKIYGDRGAPWEVIVLEFEAFGTAAGVPASDISNAIDSNCRVR